MTQKIPMTKNGAEKLHQELDNLKKVERPNVVQAIAEARAHGDLKENAEYHAAREKQGFVEARIRDLEAKLSHCNIIDVTKITNEGKVIFGSTVSLINLDSGEQVQYTMVGEDEADLKQGKISYTSPIARAIIGKFAGDTVEVQVPSGLNTFEIDSVDYL